MRWCSLHIFLSLCHCPPATSLPHENMLVRSTFYTDSRKTSARWESLWIEPNTHSHMFAFNFNPPGNLSSIVLQILFPFFFFFHFKPPIQLNCALRIPLYYVPVGSCPSSKFMIDFSMKLTWSAKPYACGWVMFMGIIRKALLFSLSKPNFCFPVLFPGLCMHLLRTHYSSQSTQVVTAFPSVDVGFLQA